MLCGCSDDDDECKIPQEKPQVEEVRYYVKYELAVKADAKNKYTTFNFATDKGIQKKYLEGSKTWEATYGPVNKGFQTSFDCTMNNGDARWTNVHGRIYVSRGKEPFVLKAEGDDGASFSLRYTIDF